MRILVAGALAPPPGQADLVDGLVNALSRAGHQAEGLRVPFDPDPRHADEQLVALRLLGLGPDPDLVIATGPPAYLVRHPRKILWLERSDPRLDRVALAEAEAAYCTSEAVRSALPAEERGRIQVLAPGDPWGPVVAQLLGRSPVPA
jgi:hypothetical protein